MICALSRHATTTDERDKTRLWRLPQPRSRSYPDTANVAGRDGMSASWEVASATQIARSGAAATGTLATRPADQIGGITHAAPVQG